VTFFLYGRLPQIDFTVPNFIIFSGYTWNEKKNNGKGVRRRKGVRRSGKE
jgi:hypothetical protein